MQLFVLRFKLSNRLRVLETQRRCIDELTLENRNLVTKQRDLIGTYRSRAMFSDQGVEISEESHSVTPVEESGEQY